MADIMHMLQIETPAERVYRAVTEQSDLASWWTTETVASPQVGSVLEFRFGDRYHNRMKIARLVPNRRVEWLCLEGDPQWVGTTFVFDLQESDGRTTLRFTHGDWREATDFYASCNFQWAYYMMSLKSLCETGKGTPFPQGSAD